MTLMFQNKSDAEILLRINDGDTILLPPRQSISARCEQTESTKISMRKNQDSHIRKSIFWNDKYALMLESIYRISNVKEQEIFEIRKDEVKPSTDIRYHRIFLQSTNNDRFSVQYHILQADQMQKIYIQQEKKWNFIHSIMDFFTIILPFPLIVSLFSKIWLTWKQSAIVFLIALAIVWLISFLANRMAENFGRKLEKRLAVNPVDEKACFSDEYANTYFAKKNFSS